MTVRSWSMQSPPGRLGRPGGGRRGAGGRASSPRGKMISPERLRRYAHCAGAPDDLLKQVAMLGGERSFQPGAELFHEDEPAPRPIILESGKGDIVHPMAGG